MGAFTGKGAAQKCLKARIGSSFAVAFLTMGCAGPSTPLGAVSWFFPDDAAGGTLPVGAKETMKIQFSPNRQVLHKASDLKVSIDDEVEASGDRPHLSVRYNGLDVSRNFLRSAAFTTALKSDAVEVHIPRVYLDPRKEHRIEFSYKNRRGEVLKNAYLAPTCHAFRLKDIIETEDFNPNPKVLKKIALYSKKKGVSPALLTALIAQESSFNPNAVSWARAIGLTQVTPIAEKEIVGSFRRWPRYPKINSMPISWLRTMILSGKINRKNEWRLDPAKSIQGGLYFLQLLRKRWSTPSNLRLVSELDPNDPETEHTRLILASYNSGYSAVKKAIRDYGKNWIHSPKLREARKYVNRIFSFCYHFSEVSRT